MSDLPKFSTEHDILVKAIITGDSGTGKSCLMKRFSDGVFVDNYISTIGVDFEIRQLTLASGKKCKLQLWDTAGQERFRSIVASYYFNCSCVLIVFDVTNPHSFGSVRGWLKEARSYANSDIEVTLVGNKTDLVSRRLVSREAAEELAAELGVPYVETSAKMNDNVDKVFRDTAERVADNAFTRLEAGKQKKRFVDPHATGVDAGGRASSRACCKMM